MGNASHEVNVNEQQLTLMKYHFFDGKPITVLKPIYICKTAMTYRAMKLNQNIT